MSKIGSSVDCVTLELSLKPFPGFDDAALTQTVSEVFRQWLPLLRAANSCSIMLWISDGSEILEWAGDLDQQIEWARYIGFNNTGAGAYGEVKATERVARPFAESTPDLDYAAIARLVRVIKQIGTEEFGIPTSVGATFDPGPEFAPSAFKFDRHPEVVARGEDVGIGPIIQMLRHSSSLRADDRPYAAYPKGLPGGTSFGEFLGRQAQDYATAMGFDYLWLSNGFGFSAFAWTDLGAGFDGRAFHDHRADALRRESLSFWEDFARHFQLPVEVRGTNHTAGIDIGSDAVPALELYEAGHFQSPPPNSPWGPLNEDFGIEMSGFLSRIAMLPAGSPGYRYRFYANDPWFWQQPWWDFYNREPFDIYLPLGVSRVDDLGRVQTPSSVNILSIDTAHGVLDERVGREVGGHILAALESTPDEAGPLVWVYPFREYHQADTSLGQPYFEDWLLTSALNAGLPVSTVVSTDDLGSALRAGALAGRALLVPAGAMTEAISAELVDHVSAGGSLVVYGAPTRLSARGAHLLGLSVETGEQPLAGDLLLLTDVESDTSEQGEMPRVLRHIELLSDGGIGAVRIVDPHAEATVRVRDEAGRERVYATARRDPSWGGGAAMWVRGSSPHAFAEPDERGVPDQVPHDPDRFVTPGVLLRDLVGMAGYLVSHELRRPSSGRAVLGLHRSRSAFWFSGYLTDTTSRVRLRLPAGVPILNHQECWLEGGVGHYQLPKSIHAECRVLVEQSAVGMIRCREIAPYPAWMTRGMRISGLREAAVTLHLPPTDRGRVRLDVDGELLDEAAFSIDADGTCILTAVTGTLTVAWEEPDDGSPAN